MQYHPCLNEKGQKHPISKPHTPSVLESWADIRSTATVVPGGLMPVELNGRAIATWAPPSGEKEWEALAVRCDFNEPEFVAPDGLSSSAGAVVLENDGRVWLVSPTNQFGGYVNTFPKGKVDEGLSLRATAIKELYEEAGLQIELTGFLVDADRSTSRCRYYLARRIGGNPADMGWESQAVHLVPVVELTKVASHKNDAPIVAALKKTCLPQA